MKMGKIIIRWIICAIAILATTWFIPGITIEGNGIIVALAVAFILGLVNALIRPILVFLSCGCIVATLGLFMFVINAASLWIASQISQLFGFGFNVDGFIPAILGSIVISIVSWLLSLVLIGEHERGR
jgi:putative membrane protein